MLEARGYWTTMRLIILCQDFLMSNPITTRGLTTTIIQETNSTVLLMDFTNNSTNGAEINDLFYYPESLCLISTLT